MLVCVVFVCLICFSNLFVVCCLLLQLFQLVFYRYHEPHWVAEHHVSYKSALFLHQTPHSQTFFSCRRWRESEREREREIEREGSHSLLAASGPTSKPSSSCVYSGACVLCFCCSRSFSLLFFFLLFGWLFYFSSRPCLVITSVYYRGGLFAKERHFNHSLA